MRKTFVRTAGHDKLADHLVSTGALPASWADSVRDVPRHLFLPDTIWLGKADAPVDRATDPDEWLRVAAADVAVVTQWDDGRAEGAGTVPTSSASMPTLVAGMLGDLDAHPGDHILEIGTGTGWNAALLARHLGDDHVTTIEVDPDVAAQATHHLAAFGASPDVVVADGAEGWPPGAPYDGVLATCSVTRIPRQWIEQTRPGGRIVTPYSPLLAGGGIARLTVHGPQDAAGHFSRRSAFMRLRAHRFTGTPAHQYLGGEWPAGADQSWSSLDPADALERDWGAAFVIGLALPDIYLHITEFGNGWTWWFFDTAVTSWATVDTVPGTERHEVRQRGPRRLWDEIESAWDRWQATGRPGVERHGLTVHGDVHTAWLDSPDNPL